MQTIITWFGCLLGACDPGYSIQVPYGKSCTEFTYGKSRDPSHVMQTSTLRLYHFSNKIYQGALKRLAQIKLKYIWRAEKVGTIVSRRE